MVKRSLRSAVHNHVAVTPSSDGSRCFRRIRDTPLDLQGRDYASRSHHVSMNTPRKSEKNEKKARGSLVEITRAMFQAFEATKDISCRCYLSVLTELES